jgi:hypothetical protein
MPGAPVIILAKPQFEAGKAEASKGKGVIRDPEIHRRTLGEVASALEAAGAVIMGAMPSPITGSAGNVEFLIHALAPGRPGSDVTPLGGAGSGHQDLPALLDAVVAEAHGSGPTPGAGPEE